jgi:hypothetical protein
MAKKKGKANTKKNITSKKCSTGLLFVAFMFLGVGLGLAVNNPGAGTLIGMGVGFLAMFLAKK